MAKKTFEVKLPPRSPDEPLRLSDIWASFNIEYLPFVKYTDGKAKVAFLDDEPLLYKNKWGREQWKLRIMQDKVEKFVSSGKRFYAALRAYCIEKHLLPTELGEITIERVGNGFTTEYKFL